MLRCTVAPLGPEGLGDGPHEWHDWMSGAPQTRRSKAKAAAEAGLQARAKAHIGLGRDVTLPPEAHIGLGRDVTLPPETFLDGLSPRTPAAACFGLAGLSPKTPGAGSMPRTPCGSPPTPIGTPGGAAGGAALSRTTTPTRTPATTPTGAPRCSSQRSFLKEACRTPPAARGAALATFGTDAAPEAGRGGELPADHACRAADLEQYGTSLGVDMQQAPELAWVVQEAFGATLPKGWTEHTDEEGRAYFFNEMSDRSEWEHPLDVVYRDLLDVVHSIREAVPDEAPDCRIRRTALITERLQDVHQKATKSLEDWSGPYTSEYGEYYYNQELEVSSWHCPIEEWEHELATCERVLSGCLLTSAAGRRLRLRAVVWTLIVLWQLVRRRSPRRSYVMDASVDPAVIRSIDCDIPRTAGGNPELGGGLGVTRSLLLRYAAEDPEVGYCQGMNLVASVFAVATQSQDEAYTRFCAFTGELRGLWLPGFPLLLSAMAQFELLAQARPWFQHLCRHHIQPDMYLPRAWMALFAKWLPLPTRVLLLPHIEGRGLAGLLAVSLAVLDLHLPWLLQQGDMDDVLACLEGLRDNAPDVAVLLAATESWLPISVAAAAAAASAARKSGASRVPLLRRQGSRVVDSSGREALYETVSKRLSTLWAERKPKVAKALVR